MTDAAQYVILFFISVGVAVGNAGILIFFWRKLKRLMAGIK